MHATPWPAFVDPQPQHVRVTGDLFRRTHRHPLRRKGWLHCGRASAQRIAAPKCVHQQASNSEAIQAWGKRPSNQSSVRPSAPAHLAATHHTLGLWTKEGRAYLEHLRHVSQVEGVVGLLWGRQHLTAHVVKEGGCWTGRTGAGERQSKWSQAEWAANPNRTFFCCGQKWNRVKFEKSGAEGVISSQPEPSPRLAGCTLLMVVLFFGYFLGKNAGCKNPRVCNHNQLQLPCLPSQTLDCAQ